MCISIQIFAVLHVNLGHETSIASIIYDLNKLTSREAKDVHHRGALPPGGDCLVAVEECDDNGGNAEEHSHSREGECCMDSVQ